MIEAIAGKQITADAAASAVIENPGMLPVIFNGLSSKKPGIRYGCSRILNRVSETRPEMVYPRFDLFANLLAGENNIFKWDTIFTIANLAARDPENKFEAVFDLYFSPIPGPVLITAVNTIKTAAGIALARPDLTQRIVQELLKVEKATYQTEECRNVALGEAIETFSRLFEQLEDKQPVLAFVTKQVSNTRVSTGKKAGEFLAKWDK